MPAHPISNRPQTSILPGKIGILIVGSYAADIGLARLLETERTTHIQLSRPGGSYPSSQYCRL
jgi:hypothetical protein